MFTIQVFVRVQRRSDFFGAAAAARAGETGRPTPARHDI